MEFRNCESYGRTLQRLEQGAMGLKKTITLREPQKVYARVKLDLGDVHGKVIIGVLDGEEWYIEEKQGKGIKTLSVVRGCENRSVDILVAIEHAERVELLEFITETVGQAKIPKRLLDKIAYSEEDIVNLWQDAPFRMISERGVKRTRKIKCELEQGRTYFIKVLTKEITNCGNMWLECGHSQVAQKGQLIKVFKYVGNQPEIAIKGDRFTYIVDIEAIMIVDSKTIDFENFLKKEYWR